MKLATRFNHTRDGELLVVSRDLTQAVLAAPIAPTLQYALDHWIECEYPLQETYLALNAGLHAAAEAFRPETCLSPLPRAYHYVKANAYSHHAERVYQLRGESLPASFWHEPSLTQGISDAFLPPESFIPLLDPNLEMDFAAEIAIVTKDVPLGVSALAAKPRICLLLLSNAITLRKRDERPYTSFSPIAITPDELGNAWNGAKLNLAIRSEHNGLWVGEPHTGIDMSFDFPTLIAKAASTRPLKAGSIISAGAVANDDIARGFACIAEKRLFETREHGKTLTAYLQSGDTVKIDVQDKSMHSIFGSIKQTVVSVMECAKAC